MVYASVSLPNADADTILSICDNVCSLFNFFRVLRLQRAAMVLHTIWLLNDTIFCDNSIGFISISINYF